MTTTRIVERGGEGLPRPRAAPPGLRPTWAEVDTDAITANVRTLAGHVRAAEVLVAVKSDGYGHGLVPAAEAALAGGATWLGVALVEEGATLRDAGVTAPILVFAEPPPEAAGGLLDHGLTPAVYTPWFADALAAAAAERGKAPAPVHVKLDTGMRRVGAPEAQWADLLRRVRDAEHLSVQGLWSHLAVADDPSDPFTAVQRAALGRGLEVAAGLGVRPRLRHLANSAGALHHPDTHLDLVRCGIAAYGLAPEVDVANPVPLRPALAWRTRVSLTKRVAEGEGVSYGLRWRASRPTTVVTVPVGYGDGVPRRLSGRGEVVVGGRRAPIVGTICMDQMLVDVGDADVATGDDVHLIGGQDEALVTTADWARWLETITYEVVCAVGGRVPRRLVGGSHR